MAPQSNGRRLGHIKAPVAFRGRGGLRARGRGRSKALSKSLPRSAFHSARVDEVREEASDAEEEPIYEDLEKKTDDVEYGSNEDESSEETPVQPYNQLLASLKSKYPREEPALKKRKVGLDGVSRGTPSEDTEQILSTPSEIDDEEGLEEEADIDEHIDSKELDAPEIQPEDIAEDPFEKHFGNVDEVLLTEALKESSSQIKYPRDSIVRGVWRAQSAVSEGSIFQPVETVKLPSHVSELYLKPKLKSRAIDLLPVLNDGAKLLAASIFDYRDCLFYERTPSNAQELRLLVCTHLLNHVYKTRDRVIRNNERLSRAPENTELEYRDQGFTRPKILILLPTRSSCVKYVTCLTALCDPEQQENKKRFEDAYVTNESEFLVEKPADFKELFDGNDDDLFRLGLKLTRKNLKFFSKFYNSDIILASPLGLRMAMGGTDLKKQDYDFLSSIEIVVIEQADALFMQNWEHVDYVFDHLNLQPKETHGCDFGRVRNWYLDGNAKFLRQSILLSAYNSPEMNGLCHRHMKNIAGQTRVRVEAYDGAMLTLLVQSKQTFSRFDASSPGSDPDQRFEYFISTALPVLLKHAKTVSREGQGILIFIPSYMDFIRVRNYFATSTAAQNISFGSISEYASVREVARARSHFASGRHAVLLYTGRAHHFRRYHIRGVKKIVFYALPDNPIFYKEVVEFLGTSLSNGLISPKEASVRSLFSTWDMLKLERIVGTKRHMTMLRGDAGDTFDFL